MLASTAEEPFSITPSVAIFSPAALGRLDADAVAELGDDARLLEFGGFDYQKPRESRLAEFAEHLIDDERWTSLAHHFGDRPGEPECPNSHTPTVERYQRMLVATTRSSALARPPTGSAGSRRTASTSRISRR
jgi:hypothetical protein